MERVSTVPLDGRKNPAVIAKLIDQIHWQYGIIGTACQDEADPYVGYLTYFSEDEGRAAFPYLRALGLEPKQDYDLGSKELTVRLSVDRDLQIWFDTVPSGFTEHRNRAAILPDWQRVLALVSWELEHRFRIPLKLKGTLSEIWLLQRERRSTRFAAAIEEPSPLHAALDYIGERYAIGIIRDPEHPRTFFVDLDRPLERKVTRLTQWFVAVPVTETVAPVMRIAIKKEEPPLPPVLAVHQGTGNAVLRKRKAR